MTASRLVCHHCSDVIGVYEPVVIVTDGHARETSKAAEPGLASIPAERYHRACYAERSGADVPD